VHACMKCAHTHTHAHLHVAGRGQDGLHGRRDVRIVVLVAVVLQHAGNVRQRPGSQAAASLPARLAFGMQTVRQPKSDDVPKYTKALIHKYSSRCGLPARGLQSQPMRVSAFQCQRVLQCRSTPRLTL